MSFMEAPKRNIEGTHRPRGSAPRREEAGERASDAMRGWLESDDCLAAGMCRVVEGIEQ
jgi:hypothetical protein